MVWWYGNCGRTNIVRFRKTFTTTRIQYRNPKWHITNTLTGQRLPTTDIVQDLNFYPRQFLDVRRRPPALGPPPSKQSTKNLTGGTGTGTNYPRISTCPHALPASKALAADLSRYSNFYTPPHTLSIGYDRNKLPQKITTKAGPGGRKSINSCATYTEMAGGGGSTKLQIRARRSQQSSSYTEDGYSYDANSTSCSDPTAYARCFELDQGVFAVPREEGYGGSTVVVNNEKLHSFGSDGVQHVGQIGDSLCVLSDTKQYLYMDTADVEIWGGRLWRLWSYL